MKNKEVLLSIDFAGKTGLSIIEEDIVIFKYKFKTKGNNERERVNSLSENTKEIFEKLKNNKNYVFKDILFEDSFAGSSKTSNKTLRATFGKRYLLISLIQEYFPESKIWCVSPQKWFKLIPDEYRRGKDGKILIGKPKKQSIVNYVNYHYDLNLIWDNERVSCENDIADSIAFGMLMYEGKLNEKTGLELIG